LEDNQQIVRHGTNQRLVVSPFARQRFGQREQRQEGRDPGSHERPKDSPPGGDWTPKQLLEAEAD